MNAHPVLLQKKYARIIDQFAKNNSISLEKALGLFYHSDLYILMSKGISDMHCRSDGYLVEDLTEECRQKHLI